MIDSGSDANLLKKEYINPTIDIDEKDKIILQGISAEPVSTLGSVSITLLGRKIKFHLVSDNISFASHGILGTGFLREHNCMIDFKKKCLHYGNSRLPFVKIERVKLAPRSVTPFHINVTNPELRTGYIPLVKSAKGVFFGNAIVSNVDGKAYLPIFNTSEQACELEIPSLSLQEFDTIDTLNAAEVVNGFRVESSESCKFLKNAEESPLDTQEYRRDSSISCGAIDPREIQLASDHRGNFSVKSSEILYVNNSSRNKILEDRVNLTIQLLRTDHLNSEEKEDLFRLIQKHSDRFHLPGDALDCTNATQHVIPTINEIPIHTKQYRFPPVHKEEINKQVGALLHDSIIEPSTSPYNSPLWIVPKKADSVGNKRWRMVIDYRALNEKTIGDAYPLPNITDILDQLGNAKYFSVLDLASGFHQIPMDPKDAPKTAFSTPYGHYQFKRMPFGLKNAPATFQRLMDNVLMGLQGNELFVYMDDIVIYARSLQEHAIKFERLMQRLRNANLKLQPDKCEFLRKEVAYLGHIIGSDGVRPDPNKINAVFKFPIPRNQKNIKQFLGLVGYYRRFIPQFSKIARPLTDLLKKDRTFIWENHQIEAFEKLKSALCTEPVLQYPDFSQPFNLTTDASGHAIGGILSQGKIGKDLPIAYVSRVLNKAEQNYSTIEKECLAIIYCTKHFRPYLYGRKFIITTDHKPLVWLHSIKDPSSRLWKWRTKLAEYDYDIHYKKGSLNNNADALSRNPPSTITLPLISMPFKLKLTTPDKSLLPLLHESNIIGEPILDLASQNSNTSMNQPPSINEPLANEFQEENNYELDDYDFSEISLSDDDEQELPPEDNTPIITELPAQTPNITETRDSLLQQKDNLVIFITLNGAPFDNGAKELHEANLFPKYEDIVYERAKVTPFKTKILIALPLKFDNHTLIETHNVKNCMQSLVDVITELQLTSFSIRKTETLDQIPWMYIRNQIRNYLRETPLIITICRSLVRTPENFERIPLISEHHASSIGGHKGVTKTYNRLRPHFYWNTMKKDIQDFIRKCRQCQLKKLTRIKTKQPMIITDTPSSAFDKVSLDIMGPLPTTSRGNSYILTMQDLLTKYSVAVPLQETTSLAIADAFTKNFICLYGAPKAILTDQGTNFLSSLIRNLTKKFNIKQYKTTAYHPQSNGSLERSHHVLTEYLKTQITRETEWDEHIPLAMFSYNTSVHESTKYSPFQLIFGRLPRTPASNPPLEENTDVTYTQYLTDLFNNLQDTQEDARENLIASKTRSKHYYDRRINPQNFQVGSHVFLLKEPQKGKLSDQYTGPHTVLEILPNNNVKIQFFNRTRIVHVDKLKISHIDPG